MRDAAESEYCLELGQRGDARLEKAETVFCLGGRRPVLRRNAANRIGNHRLVEFEPVIGACIVPAFREAEFRQRAVEKIARIVAGKGAAGAICALDTGSETDDQEARIPVAK